MTATLRVVLEQPLDDVGSDLARASVQLARALVRTAPGGCEVSAIAPASTADAARALVPGLREVKTVPLQRRELVAAWQLGVAPTTSGGFVHSPTLAAPLVRHDRANTGDQSVVTLWDLRAWEASSEMHRAAVAWHRGMMKRVARHADAIVVPSFAHADRLDEEFGLGERARVIPGAAPAGFSVPTDVIARVRELELPEAFVAIAGDVAASDGLVTALRAAGAAVDAGMGIVVFQTRDEDHDSVRIAAAEAGVRDDAVQIVGLLDDGDRGALIGSARALVAATTRTQWPWRTVEALAVGTPIVALDTPVLREVIADGGVVASADRLRDALAAVLADENSSLPVLAADRGRVFSWTGSAERIWQLHAEL